MRRVLFALALSALSVVPGAAAAAGAPAPSVVRHVDVSHYPTVSVDVVATDASGVDVAEAGQGVSATFERLGGDDLQIVLAIDTSGSMAGAPLDNAKTAAIDFIGRMSPSAQLAVVGFGAQPSVAAALSVDRAASSAAIRGLVARGETALYDAVALSVQQFTGSGRHEVVVLSDGGDTVSKISLDAVVAQVGAAGVSLDAVELVTRDARVDALNALAAAGHGTVVPADQPEALAAVYARVAASLTSQYRVTWTSTGHGDTPVHLVVRTAAGDVAGDTTLALPAAAAAPTTVAPRPAPAPKPAPARTPVPKRERATKAFWLQGTRPLAIGGVAFFLALVLALSGALGPVQRRARLARLGRTSRHREESGTLSRLAERVSEKADEALERGGNALSLNKSLEKAGLALRPGEYVVLVLCAVVTMVLLGSVLAGFVVGILLAAVAVIVAALLPGILAERRRTTFGDQLGDTLQLLSSSLRAGYGLLQAADAVGREAASPTSDEFRRVIVETRLGRDLSTSLRAAAERVSVVDFDWVVQAIEIQREVGGDLAEILDNVAGTIRDRNQLHRQVKALTAEGRYSAYVLLALPFALAFMMHLINPSYMNELFHGFGLVLVAVMAVLMTAGALWLKKLCRLVF